MDFYNFYNGKGYLVDLRFNGKDRKIITTRSLISYSPNLTTKAQAPAEILLLPFMPIASF